MCGRDSEEQKCDGPAGFCGNHEDPPRGAVVGKRGKHLNMHPEIPEANPSSACVRHSHLFFCLKMCSGERLRAGGEKPRWVERRASITTAPPPWNKSVCKIILFITKSPLLKWLRCVSTHLLLLRASFLPESELVSLLFCFFSYELINKLLSCNWIKSVAARKIRGHRVWTQIRLQTRQLRAGQGPFVLRFRTALCRQVSPKFLLLQEDID